jgi:hypothetical protein
LDSTSIKTKNERLANATHVKANKKLLETLPLKISMKSLGFLQTSDIAKNKRRSATSGRTKTKAIMSAPQT